ncbi:MAG: beta-galactosidase [Enterococcus lemanii]|jgi:beta-galactosidase
MTMFKKMLFGGDYNPEQWPEEIWLEDMHLLKDAQINTATINVFAWALLQPDEATYDFSILDKIVEMLVKNNYAIIMGTSTAALPAWMSQRYPDVNRTDFYGLEHKYGHRHNACPNSPTFRKYGKRLAGKIAERYGHLEELVCWHISNEYSGECYCDNCAKAFRVWLKKKYGSIEAVNKAWNTNFWSHTFYSFEEIVPPNYLGDGIPNDKASFGGLSLDYARFNSQSIMQNFIDEKQAIRAFDDTTPVTTNLMGAYKPLNYFEFAKEMDIISWDAYPSFDTPFSYSSMMHDLMRGLRDGQPFMLMEQTPSQQNWQPFNSLKRPGQMRQMSYHAVAHGADTVQFFQLRRCIGAGEKFHGAVIDHVGTNETRVFKEVKQLGKELANLGDILLDGRTPAKVGLIFDWENYWALESAIGPNVELKYVDQVHRYYRELYKRNIPVDMVGLNSEFSHYDVLLAPCLYLLNEQTAEKIETFTKNGGTFVTSTMSGLVDENDNVHLGGYPGPLKNVTGIWVEEFDAMPSTKQTSVKFGEKLAYGTLLCDIIHPRGASVVATYGEEEFYRNTPVITMNAFGNGQAYYIGTVLDDTGMKLIFDQILTEKNIPSLYLPEGIEMTERVNSNGRFVFVMNHLEKEETIDVSFKGKDVLTNTEIEPTFVLAPFDVKIIKVI